MKVLAFDASGPRLSIVIQDGKKELASFQSAGEGRHSESLVPQIEKLLKKSRLSMKKIGCVAVGLGPGSFTGLRIGVTTAKMLAFASGSKLVGVPSLEASARGAAPGGSLDGEYVVMSDARKDQVYGAFYRCRGGKWSASKKPAIYGREEFVKMVPPDAFVVDGSRPPASGVAEAALERAKAGKFDDPTALLPLYLHPKDCNVQKK